MASSDWTMDMIFLTQTVVGILGNFSLLCHHIILPFTGYRLRSTDLILKHLIVANFLTLLGKGVPQTMAAFGLKHFPSDSGCKLLFFLHRVGRGVSIGSICLLSVFQVMTISPRNSRWTELKVKAPKCIVPSIFLCWMLHMMVNTIFPMDISGKWSNKNITNRKDFGYCSSVRHDKTRDALYAALLLFPDVVCLELMLWASGSMVSILYRHKQWVQHIRRTRASSSISPESRAAKTILLLSAGAAAPGIPQGTAPRWRSRKTVSSPLLDTPKSRPYTEQILMKKTGSYQKRSSTTKEMQKHPQRDSWQVWLLAPPASHVSPAITIIPRN
ncbi:vomeronasal type-1 receptor 4-like [Hippopotamus amphibius kiboko]|uniref:vomeronasal type-1 receptor 4-like n=1 Tax=Hippopotamus amphibius kiboko TaxID=575201 RepID=UPI0025997EF3|nr:vomeronasal type-1 receptor 4-like [Hippopotamus amphibius kiboko]